MVHRQQASASHPLIPCLTPIVCFAGGSFPPWPLYLCYTSSLTAPTGALGSWKGFWLLAEVPRRWNHAPRAPLSASVRAPACCHTSSPCVWCRTPVLFSLSRCFTMECTKHWNLQNHIFFFFFYCRDLPVIETKSCHNRIVEP